MITEKGPTRVVFVCLGNICRSPAAEAAMNALVVRAGLTDRVVVDSAGTAGWHIGDSPDRRTRDEAQRRGWPLAHKGRQFSRADFDRFDLVIAMDHDNVAELTALARTDDERAKIRRLMEFHPTGDHDGDVPDPYYGDEAQFREVFDLCETGCAGLLTAITDRFDAG